MPTDNELRREVERELEWEPSLDERRIGVSVDGGIVTLTGEVKSYAERWKAERTVERVKGVRGIANELSVHTSVDRTDTDIAKAAVDALRWNVSVPADSVKVRVEKGWLTLEGEVPWDYQRRAAERAVRSLSWGERHIQSHPGEASGGAVQDQGTDRGDVQARGGLRREPDHRGGIRRRGDTSRFVALLGGTPRSREGRLVGSWRYSRSQHDHRRPGARRRISLPTAAAVHMRSCFAASRFGPI